MSSSNVPRSSSRVRNRTRTRDSMGTGTNDIDARRVLTYDDESHNNYVDSHRSPIDTSSHVRPSRPSPDSLRYVQKIIGLAGTEGIAIVLPQSSASNRPLDYAGAVRRQNPNNGSGTTRRFRQALPPRGRPPCCNPRQQLNKTQAREGSSIHGPY